MHGRQGFHPRVGDKERTPEGESLSKPVFPTRSSNSGQSKAHAAQAPAPLNLFTKEESEALSGAGPHSLEMAEGGFEPRQFGYRDYTHLPLKIPNLTQFKASPHPQSGLGQIVSEDMMGHCKTWWASSLSFLHPFSPHRAVVCGPLGPWAEERKIVKGTGKCLLGCCRCKVGASCSLWLRHGCWIFVDGRVLWGPSSLENVFQGFHAVGPLEACSHLTDGSILRQQALSHGGLCQDSLCQDMPPAGSHRRHPPLAYGKHVCIFLVPPRC